MYAKLDPEKLALVNAQLVLCVSIDLTEVKKSLSRTVNAFALLVLQTQADVYPTLTMAWNAKQLTFAMVVMRITQCNLIKCVIQMLVVKWREFAKSNALA